MQHTNELPGPREQLRRDVLRGLSQPLKTIPSKYFYDARGCRLFERICEQDEYYLTRTELAIMERHVGEMARCLGPRAVLIEYGSGAGVKTRLLLESLQQPRAYVPLDIAVDHLQDVARDLRQQFPDVDVLPLQADFTQPFQLPEDTPAGRRAVYFPGSTIGNLLPQEARRLLAGVHRVTAGGGLLLGMDLVKDPATLEAAYNDSQGVTAEFNMNLLRRVNRELDADFDLGAFRHRAWYNAQHQRMEMHLQSLGKQQVRVDGVRFDFARDETIRTELSHKYSHQSMRDLTAAAEMEIRHVWSDPQRLFSVIWAESL